MQKPIIVFMGKLLSVATVCVILLLSLSANMLHAQNAAGLMNAVDAGNAEQVQALLKAHNNH
ncbi:MAG TPA: hypothetical protein VFA55_05700, partial [Candidatus Kapabacteria bacterium]|nr:hypothetical protein [Candidatus Kapabacteria bacterium]